MMWDTRTGPVALGYVPRALRSELCILAAEGAGAEDILERAWRLDPVMKWMPDAGRLERDADALERMGGRAVLAGDDTYPPLLRQIHDPPLCLYARGVLPDPTTPAVAIVGSRASVGNSLSFAEELSRALAAYGVTVVSGMARGIDGAAHKGCLTGGAKTVAVLGCGVDVCYPRDNRLLMKRIIDGGAVISEYPMGTPPTPYHFPARNRIISGCCSGTVVVEAARHSGALVTADYASEQGRVVFAVPGAVWNPLAEGPNALLRDGAVPVRGAHDVIEEMFGIAPRDRGDGAVEKERMTRDERAVLSALDYDVPRHVDAVCGCARVSAPRTLTLLLELEIKGLARQFSGKRFIRLNPGG